MKKYLQFLDRDGDIEGSVIAKSRSKINAKDETNIERAWCKFYNSVEFDFGGFDDFIPHLNNNFPKIQFERFCFDNVFNA